MCCVAGNGYNETSQAVCYQAMFQAVYDQPWFDGVYFWAWTTNPDDAGVNGEAFTPNGRQAGVDAHVGQLQSCRWRCQLACSLLASPLYPCVPSQRT